MNGIRFYVTGFYLHSHKKLRYLNFEKSIERVNLLYSNVMHIVGGDFNCYERSGRNFLHEAGFSTLSTLVTRSIIVKGKEKQSRLDIVAAIGFQNVRQKTQKVSFSDHFLLTYGL